MNLTSFLIDWRGIAGRRHQQRHKLQRKQQQQQQQIIAAFNRRDTTALKQTKQSGSLEIIYYISYMWNNCFNFCFFIIVNLKIWRKKIIVVMESYRVRWSKQRIKTKLFVKIETRIGSSQFHEQTTIVLRNKRYSEVIGNFPLDNNNTGSV